MSLLRSTDHSVANIMGFKDYEEAPNNMDGRCNHEGMRHRRRRSRTIYSRYAIEQMEAMFEENQYPDIHQREALAHKIGVEEARVQVWFQNRRARSHKREKEPSARTPHRYNVTSSVPQILSKQKQMNPSQSLVCHQDPTPGPFPICYPVCSYPSLYPQFLPRPSHAMNQFMYLEVQHRNATESSLRLPSYYGNDHFRGEDSVSQMLTNQSSPEMNNRRFNIAGPFYADLYNSKDADGDAAATTVSSTPKSAFKRKMSLPRRFETVSPLPELAMNSENRRLETPYSDRSFSPCSSLAASGDWSRLNDTPESAKSDNSGALNLFREESKNGKENSCDENNTEENGSTTGNSDSGIGQDVGD